MAAFSFAALANVVGPIPLPGVAFGGIDDDEVAGSTLFGEGGGIPPLFDLQPGSTTPNNLPDALTVNGTAMTLVLACDGQGEASTTWSCRDASGAVTLTEAGAGTAPASSTLTPFHAFDSAERGVTFAAAAKRYDAASAAVGDIATEDFVVEFVGIPTASAITIDKSLASTDGWRFGLNSSSSFRFSIRTGAVSTLVGGPTVSPLNWNHVLTFVDRNEASTNGCIVYVNGAPGSGVDVSARAGSLTNAVALAVGGVSASTSTAQTVATIRVWKCAGCMVGGAGNPAEWAPIARDRTAVAFGVSPSSSTPSPTTLSRASSAFIDAIDGTTRALFSVGNAAPRVSRRGAAAAAVAGFLGEPQTTNLALQSQTLGTTWTAISVGDNVLADTFAGADITTTGDDVDCSALATDCGLRQSVTLTATTYTASAWARPGSGSWFALRNSTVANAVAFFDTTACAACNQLNGDCGAALGTIGAGVIQARANPWPVDTDGDGSADITLCRASISFTGTVAAHNIDLLCADGDNDLSIVDADALANCGFWGAEVEAFPTMTSYQSTTTSTVTRSADDVRYGADAYNGTGATLDTAVLCPNFATTYSSFSTVASGVLSQNYFGNRQALSTQIPGSVGVVGGAVQWNIGGTGDVSDGATHSLRTTAANNDFNFYFDGTLAGNDAVGSMPAAGTSFVFLGTDGGVAAQSACLVTRVRLWNRVLTPTVAP